MNVFVVPDIHQTNVWVKPANDAIERADKIVFLGDYVDSFYSYMLRNTDWSGAETVRKVVDFKNKFPDKVILLFGNHDFSYIANTEGGQSVSGHQFEDHYKIRKVFMDNLHLFSAVVMLDGVVYSHAGVSVAWFEQMGKPSIEEINEGLYNINENLFNWNGTYDGCGNEPQQTPFWIRPTSLINNHSRFNMLYDRQVVGHTELEKTVIYNNRNIFPENGFLMICDSKERDKFQWVIDGVPELLKGEKT